MKSNARRILVVDRFPEAGIERFRALGWSVDYRASVTADELREALAPATMLIVRSTKVNAGAIEGAPQLQLIVRAGAGVDNIDLAKASTLGIYVSNCPGKNAAAVAELALGLLIAADRRIPEATAELKAGHWNKKEFSKARGLKGRTLGILGVGRIGELVIERAKAFGLRILACSRSLTPERAQALGVEFCPDIYVLARRSDAVSIHLALNAETHHLVDDRFLAELRPGAILINTSRGEVIDAAALERAVGEKGIRPALDVFEGEPAAPTGAFELAEQTRRALVGTPHIGASTDQAQEAIADEAVRIVEEFVKTGSVPNCVNLAQRTPARWLLVVRHLDRVGVLAGIFGELRTAGINVQRTNNIVFQGAHAAVARIELDTAPSENVQATLGRQAHVLSVEVLAMDSRDGHP